MEKSSKLPDRLIVTGTDTGVGKTVLSLLLMQFFFAEGFNPFYLKPFQTGCIDPYDAESDARFIYKNVGHLKGKDPADSITYCFLNPKAPLFASRNEKRDIDIKVIQDAVVDKSKAYFPLIIESAGGLYVPVTEDIMMVDIIKLTGAVPIIAARAGLGTINHTLLTVEALEKRKIPPVGIILIDSGEIPTEQQMISENIEAIEKASGIKICGVIGRIKDFSCPEDEYYAPVRKIFGRDRGNYSQLQGSTVQG